MLSLVIKRPWCKYFFALYGALLGIFNKIRVFKIKGIRKHVLIVKNVTGHALWILRFQNPKNVNNFSALAVMNVLLKGAARLKIQLMLN